MLPLRFFSCGKSRLAGVALAALTLSLSTNTQAAQPDGLLDSFARSTLVLVPAAGPCIYLDIYIADTPRQQAQGLMYIKSMDTYEGMLFVYNTARRISMWMKNTLIPLDMLFIDDKLEIVDIAKNAVPGSSDTIRSSSAVNLVLELNAGSAEKWGLQPGDTILTPGS
ncbi:MAG: DUF192 domain-containing protein [Gammaproteobacteria bacterium]